jgi:hypothetical protein
MVIKTSKTLIRALIVALFIIINSIDLLCQDKFTKIQKNSLNIEAATGIYIGDACLNYERAIVRGDQINLIINTGIGIWYLAPVPNWYSGLSIPLSLNSLLGSGNNFFEIDIGLRYTFYNAESNQDRSPTFPIFNLGYRFQKPDGNGLIFRSFVGLSGIGIGVGKSF